MQKKGTDKYRIVPFNVATRCDIADSSPCCILQRYCIYITINTIVISYIFMSSSARGYFNVALTNNHRYMF
jgi:hypothetical protein